MVYGLTGASALYFQAIQGDSAVQAGIKQLPLLIATVICSTASGGLVTVVGYYNPFILPCMVLFTVGSGMITTLGLDSPLREWFGYQVLAGRFLVPFSSKGLVKLTLPKQASESVSVSKLVSWSSRTS
jgi:hypothetical protein